MQLLARSLLISVLAAFIPSTAWACHDSECRPETPTVVAVGIAADAGLLLLDVHWAAGGTRPGRAWGALELGVAGLNGLMALASGVSEDHDYQAAAQLGMAAAAVVAAHGVYVLIRGEDPGPSAVGIAPVVHDDGAGVVLSGRF